MLKILAPQRYPWTFAGPRSSKNIIIRKRFLPLNKVSRDIEGVTVILGDLFQDYDLIHAFNRIPLGRAPYVIGCESHLPRGFGIEASYLYRMMVNSLLSERCKAIVPISHFAEKIIRRDHAEKPWAKQFFEKIVMQYPSINISKFSTGPETGEIKIAFVGNHFARKGGCVALRIAELANEQKIPVELTIVSTIEVGSRVWTDPKNARFFEKYKSLLNMSNVKLYQNLGNADVMRILERSHFSILTTFSDTFGYSALESMACGTPVLATHQGALPEFIRDGESGILLKIPVNSYNEWIHGGRSDRHTLEYEKIFAGEIERLASAGLSSLLQRVSNEESYARMRLAAHNEIRKKFDPDRASQFWDNLYRKSVSAP